MITLRGKVSVQRLSGIVNIVPSAGNPPLQAKVVYPSHSEQIVKPDDDFYGLSIVTVVATPRLPACVVSAVEGGDRKLEIMIDIEADVSVTGEVFVQTHALYGGVRLPLLPEDVLAQYPYCWIWKDPDTAEYKAFFSTAVWYYYDVSLKRSVSETSPVYVYSEENDAWEFSQNHSATQKLGNSSAITWTNFNIPKGSATATSYQKTATEPGITV